MAEKEEAKKKNTAFSSFKKAAGYVAAGITIGGLFLWPSIGAAAGGVKMLAAADPTLGLAHGDLISSFHSLVYTDPVTHDTGVTEGFNRISTGYGGIFESFYHMGSKIASGESFMTTWNTPLNPNSPMPIPSNNPMPTSGLPTVRFIE